MVLRRLDLLKWLQEVDRRFTIGHMLKRLQQLQPGSEVGGVG
jgi:hypothetical protein